jgi:transcriptional regulator with XRE-family HTH domain
VTEDAAERVQRGREIARRRRAITPSQAQAAKAMGMDRATLKGVEEGAPNAREASFTLAEAWLDRMEDETAETEHEATAKASDLIEFQMTGDPGMTFTVKGPVADRAELEDSFLRIVERLRGGGQST